MKERPILMNEQSIGPILDGRKTQTRRVITPQPVVGDEYSVWTDCKKWGNAVVKFTRHGYAPPHSFAESIARHCPYGVPGDRLWVREAWQLCSHGSQLPGLKEFRTRYLADGTLNWVKCGRDLAVLKEVGFKPSIFMPREFSRLTLEITSVGVERIQEISKQDAIAEGVDWRKCPMYQTEAQLRRMVKGWGTAMTVDYIGGFKRLWNSINASPGLSWSDNPWVWVVEFERIQ
jgi:hypothetical protein